MTPEQILQPREIYFKPVKLGVEPLFCGDERPGNYDGPYIHLMGGALSPVYTNMIVRETNNPGSVVDSFTAETALMVPELIAIDAKPGIHSDTNSEPDHEYHKDADGPVGCGFAKLRQTVSKHIADNGPAIVGHFAQLYPELYQTEEDKNFANNTVPAHARLSERSELFTSGGRDITNAAVEAGAETMLVTGQHIGTEGIINDDPTHGFDNNLAHAAGLAAYVHDVGISKEIQNRLRDKYPLDGRQQQIAEIIDAIGTMNALGVPLENIVRRAA